ncbi:MAG: L,D-transpeptidase [Aestuariivirga sp.]|uniref:L,D-transpeptidase n=1 Tax=Aestuariivirga sp. TaxID=2650926 RepID=UPI003018DC2B
MISRRKLILALSASLLPAASQAATGTTPPPPEKAKPVAAKPAPSKPAAKKQAVAKPAAKKQVAKKKAPPAPPRLIITINKVSQKMTVELDGNEVYKWPVSTGAPGFETPSGTFRPFRLEKEHFSKEWDDAPMPYSIFFTGQGHAVHGSYHVKSLGRRASHGCVRLHPDNAAKLFALVQKTGTANTRVIVKGGLFADGTVTTDKVKRSNPFKNWFN